MESEHQRLSWLSFFKWIFNDTVNKTYTSEEKSRFYDQVAKDFFHRDRLAGYLTQKITSYFPAQQPYICERAAGSGIITERLYKKGFTKIRASDLSESQLLVLKEKLKEIEISIENFNELIPSVSDNSFDVVFQVGATRFMTRPGQLNYIKEAARTLKEGGIIIWPVMWGEIVLNWVRAGKGPKTSSFNIAKLLQKEGFEIVESPWVIHGKMGMLSTTLLIAKKIEKTAPQSSLNTIMQLVRKWTWDYLGKKYE
ncbi:MAG: ubiquinone/menaquinone biosynthesis C-methylase UbiE [Maribacter sp.]|jgi:ubiquinone/menaquinone biosynthesis C-methylase UbiE